MKKLLIICGPTAVGKSDLALKLAKILNTQIISCDSMQVYKTMDIGTAKPDKNEQELIKYNLIDIVNPDTEFSVFDYVSLCKDTIETFNKKNMIPLIVGGTGLYIRSLLFSYDFADSNKNEKTRQKLIDEVKTYGNEYLYKKLQEVDSESAKVLHQNDTKRIIRALEIFYETGVKKSETASQHKSDYDYLLIGLKQDREKLYEKINLRVDLMMQNGLLTEVKKLYEKYGKNHQSMQAIGYKELISYIEGEYSLDFAVDKIKQYSRNYAKRQITYFKTMPGIAWLDADDENLSKKVIDLYQNV